MTDIPQHCRPRLAPHVRLSFDARRSRWVVVAPERVLEPDAIALTILRRCTGEAALTEIIGSLQREFDAEPEEIARDVAQLLSELSRKGVVLL